MKEKIECKGFWWLPSNPEEAVAGILTYTPGNEIILELIGMFDPKKTSIIAFLDKKPESIIHGISSDSKKITLINCNPFGSLNLNCRFPITKYNCSLLIIGTHIEDYYQKRFFKAKVVIPELNDWCPPSVFRNEALYSNNDKISSFSISFDPEGKTVNNTLIDDNTEIKLKEGVYFHSDHFSPSLEQFTYLEIIKREDSSLIDFYSNIFLFEQFLSLATLQNSISSEITLFDKSEFQELENDEKIFNSIQIIYPKRYYESILNKRRQEFLFYYKSISEDFSQIIKTWYVAPIEFAPIKLLLIDSFLEKRVYSSFNFLIIIQALEGFCTRFRKEDCLFNMIQMIIDEFSNIDKLLGDNINIKQVVDSRHYYSHYMKKSKKPNTLDGIELYYLMDIPLHSIPLFRCIVYHHSSPYWTT